jgi:hypothetical protein
MHLSNYIEHCKLQLELTHADHTAVHAVFAAISPLVIDEHASSRVKSHCYYPSSEFWPFGSLSFSEQESLMCPSIQAKQYVVSEQAITQQA